ncbi:MAG: hypothetical protein WKF36_11145, partial [Candidatus Nitrosocosmicus sp.]
MITYAHNFNTDDNSSFLTLINMLIIENRLLNDSIPINNNPSYMEHIENTENILEDILISEDSFTVNSDQFYNNTVIALVVANLADEVLRNYGHAFGVPSNIMLSMNFSKIINSQNKSDDTANRNIKNNHTMHQANSSAAAAAASAPMIDKPSYISTIKLSDRILELYSNELNGTSSEYTYINKAKSDLGSAVYELKKAGESKESPYKIMEIVHGKVHPNLQLAFNLTLK